MTVEIISEQRCHDGTQGFYSHTSEATGTLMRFAVYLPPQQLRPYRLEERGWPVSASQSSLAAIGTGACPRAHEPAPGARSRPGRLGLLGGDGVA